MRRGKQKIGRAGSASVADRGRVSYSGYQSIRLGGGKAVVRLHPDKEYRPNSQDSFYGKFRCSVVLPTD